MNALVFHGWEWLFSYVILKVNIAKNHIVLKNCQTDFISLSCSFLRDIQWKFDTKEDAKIIGSRTAITHKTNKTLVLLRWSFELEDVANICISKDGLTMTMAMTMAMYIMVLKRMSNSIIATRHVEIIENAHILSD